MNVQFSLHAINRILFQTHLLTCKCHPVSFSVITTIIGSCTSTPTPKLNYAWPRALGKNFVGAKRNRLGVYLFVKCFFLKLGSQFSLRTIKKILFQTHLLTCKCHPVRFSAITIIEPCTSTPTPKLVFTRVHASWEERKQWLVI